MLATALLVSTGHCPQTGEPFRLTVTSIFYANVYRQLPLVTVGGNGSGLYIIKERIDNTTDETVYALPTSARFGKQLERCFGLADMVHPTPVYPGQGRTLLRVNGVNAYPPGECWTPLCPQSPFAKVPAHSSITVTVFCQALYQQTAEGRKAYFEAIDRGDVIVPHSVSATVYSEGDRERLRAEYYPTASSDSRKALEQAAEQARRINLRSGPLAKLEATLDDDAILGGQADANRQGYSLDPDG